MIHNPNLGAHFAKVASVREHAQGERCLKYPMKKVGGEWQRISWEPGIDEIGDNMPSIREEGGPDSVDWLGSAKHDNEQTYLFRKLAAYGGTNNVDHQTRICHSTTVTGGREHMGPRRHEQLLRRDPLLARDLRHRRQPGQTHPVALLLVRKANGETNAPVILRDPRYTRTAAHADEYFRFRPGTDVALVWGILWHIFENGWEDREFIGTRVRGMDKIRDEVAKWTPGEVERVTGAPGSQLEGVARTLATNRPGTVVWCRGGTRHANGNDDTRGRVSPQ